MNMAAPATPIVSNAIQNKLQPEDRPAHAWYRFVLSFPPHLIRDYLERFGISRGNCVLDPFCGTGTTLVECKKMGVGSVGVEANPVAHFASSVKLSWDIDGQRLKSHAETVAESAEQLLTAIGLSDEPHPLFRVTAKSKTVNLQAFVEDAQRLLLANSISPIPLHKSITLRDCIRGRRKSVYRDHELLALIKAVVDTSSNLHFGPEVGVRKPKADAPVISPWLEEIRQMSEHLCELEKSSTTSARVIHSDSRQIESLIEPESIDAVITSPPYPNEKDYTRTTRLESVLLGLVNNKAELRELKKNLVRSNTRGVYKGDDDDLWVQDHKEIAEIAQEIEDRRIKMGKTSGFERMYGRVTKLYFGGMAKHLAGLRKVLKPGAKLAYVVGDQASYLQVMIRTGQLLAEIAEGLGYKVESIDLFRTRLSTATKQQLREEVVVLSWPSKKR
jgi:DNA modification methylase